MEVTINKLDGIGVDKYKEIRSEVFIGDYFLGILKERAVCQPCNIWSAKLFIPNMKNGFAVNRKYKLSSIKAIVKRLKITTAE